MVLFINACVREESRTKRIADRLISNLNDEVREVHLSEVCFPQVDTDFLQRRDAFIAKHSYSDAMFEFAKDFALVDTIVIAAPFWDLSFPAALKQYFEQINVLGITFVYTPEGFPKGLCRARKLYYVTTAGGNYVSWDFGFGYVKALAEGYYGIPEIELIQATGLDIDGADVEGIMAAALKTV